MRNPIIIYENKDCLFLSRASQFRLKTFPTSILWIHQGLYGLIPSGVIQNELRVRSDRAKIAKAEGREYHDIPLGFRWAETEDVPNGAKITTLLEENDEKIK